MIYGNKGEWSELYVLLRLLADGKLYSATEGLQKIENVYMPILSIFRHELEGYHMEYKIPGEHRAVELYINGHRHSSIPREVLDRYARKFLYGIQHGTTKGAFEINGAERMMDDIKCTKIKAPSDDKTDIRMQIHDRMTGYNAIVGYSIKSKLGNPATLLNASGATNFIYKIVGMDDSRMNSINNINTSSKIKDRLMYIGGSKLKFYQMANNTFADNLLLIDSNMERIVAEMLLSYYSGEAVYCSAIARILESHNPLHYSRKGVYTYKIKKLLCAVALGLMPSKVWDGQDEANGGYIIVKEDGDVLAYHLYNRNAFEGYLLNNTKLETASTTRHGFGTIYKQNNDYFINLNLQIRFV